MPKINTLTKFRENLLALRLQLNSISSDCRTLDEANFQFDPSAVVSSITQLIIQVDGVLGTVSRIRRKGLGNATQDKEELVQQLEAFIRGVEGEQGKALTTGISKAVSDLRTLNSKLRIHSLRERYISSLIEHFVQHVSEFFCNDKCLADTMSEHEGNEVASLPIISDIKQMVNSQNINLSKIAPLSLHRSIKASFEAFFKPPSQKRQASSAPEESEVLDGDNDSSMQSTRSKA